jgi:hypothetical protein
MILEFVIIRLIVLIRGNILAKVPHRKEGIPTKTRSRSVPDVAVLNSQLLTELLIKCRRLPRVFFWNTFLPVLVYIIG